MIVTRIKKLFSQILSEKQEKFISGITFLLILGALIIGLYTRIILLSSYIDFHGDQVRDAFVMMDMRNGIWPTLGPSVSLAKFSLPPLYYYLVFPFSLISPDPIWQVVPNALFSFISIPLLMYVIFYVQNQKQNKNRRLLTAALGGFFWSICTYDILLNSKEWNPSPIPCFILLWLVVFQAIFKNKDRSGYIYALLWIAQGIILAILMSLHASTLLISPLIFLYISGLWLYRKRTILYPILALGTVLISFLPYWQGEIMTGWENTKHLFDFILGDRGEKASGILIFLNNGINHYFEMITSVYFIDSALFALGAGFGSLLLVYAYITKWRKDETYKMLIIIYVSYFMVSMFYHGDFYVHYGLPIIFAPIIFIARFFSFTYEHAKHKIAGYIALFFVGISFWQNITYSSEYINTKISEQRVLNTHDMIRILQQLPEHSRLCTDSVVAEQMNFLDRFMTRKNIDLYTDYVTCPRNSYILIGNWIKTAELSPSKKSRVQTSPTSSPVETNGIYHLLLEP